MKVGEDDDDDDKKLHKIWIVMNQRVDCGLTILILMISTAMNLIALWFFSISTGLKT